MNFLRHQGAVFERQFGLVDVSVSYKERTQPDWEDAQEANSITHFEAAPKNLQNRLGDGIGLIEPRSVMAS